MACLILTLTHYFNQCWLIISEVNRHSAIQQEMLRSILDMSLKITNSRLELHLPGANKLTHCGLVMPYGDRYLGHDWSIQWPVAWWHQAITWTNVEQSLVRSLGIHLSTISQGMLTISVVDISLKMLNSRFHLDLPGTNELSRKYPGPE